MHKQLSLFFNAIQIPDWIKIINIDEDILPELDVTKDKTEFGNRKIKITFSVIKNKFITEKQQNELKNFLKGDNWNLSDLIIQNRIYKAKVSDFRGIDGNIRKGTGDIEFTCYDGYLLKTLNAYKYILDVLNKDYKIYNLGDFDVYPEFKIFILGSCNKIKIESGNNFLELNGSFNKNDILEINQKNFRVSKNGLIEMNLLYLKSKRIIFLANTQNILKITDGNAHVELNYMPKFI